MSQPTSFATLKQQFFDGYIARQPEEGSTLGLHAGDQRLRDHSPEALADEQRFFTTTQTQLEAIDADTLSGAERHDYLVMQRVVAHHNHLGAALYKTVDWSMYPCTMLQMQLAHAESRDEMMSAAKRMAAVAPFLQQQQHNLAAAVAAGVKPDAQLSGYFSAVQLPAAAGYFRNDVPRLVMDADDQLTDVEIAEVLLHSNTAAKAYADHQQWLSEDILPHCVDTSSLGEGEVTWRLENTLGIRRSPSDLVVEAQTHLDEIQRQFVAVANIVAASAAGAPKRIESMADARDLANAMQARTIAQDSEVIPTYRGYLDRALQLAADKHLFHMPEDYAVTIAVLPPGLKDVGHAANWPAPLCDVSKRGHFAVAPEGGAHSLAWAADLAVHEGFPGHHLQSVCWQRHFHAAPAPVRFLLVHDQVAVPRHYWGAMLNIEGYAVYAEELMRQAGLFTPAEEMFVLLAHAVRAARVVVDMQLHCGAMTAAEATRYLMDNVCFSESVANREVRRYLQIPLQASTYLLGRLAIERLKTAWRAQHGGAASEADFHQRFFSFGPLPPDVIADSMLATSGS